MQARSRLAGNMYLLSSLVLGVVAVIAALEGEFVRAGLAVAAFLAATSGPVPGVCAVLLAIAFGEYAVAAGAVPALFAFWLSLGLRATRERRVDLEALSTEYGALAPALHARLRDAAGAGPITTWHMVRLASSRDPQLWDALLGEDPGSDAFDGAPIPDPRGGQVSHFAAEAVGVGHAICEELARPMDADVLAVAASQVPLSCAGEWVKRTASTEVFDVGPAQAAAGLMSFADRPAGAHMVARNARLLRVPDALQEELSREQLATLERGGVGRLRLLSAGIFVAALGEVLADLLRDLARWLARLPRRLFRALIGLPAALRARRSRRVQVAPREPDARPSAVARTDRVRTPRDRRERLAQWLVPWGGLPVILRIAWLAVRPSLACGAIAAAGAIDQGAWWQIVIVVAATGVRGLRVPAAGIALALLVMLVSPIAGAVLLARGLIGEAVLLLLGSGSLVARRAGGVDRVVAARRELVARIDLPVAELPAAQAALQAAAIDGDDDEAFERAIEVAAAAWVEARRVRFARAIAGLARGALIGVWGDDSGHASFDGEFRRLFVLESLAGIVVRIAPAIVAAVVSAIAFRAIETPLGTGEAATRATAAAVAVAAAWPLSAARVARVGAVVLAAVGLLVLGQDALGPLAVGLTLGLASRGLRRAWMALSLGGANRTARWPMPGGIRRPERAVWAAAERAATDGRTGQAIDMLSTLAESVTSRTVAAASHARLAVWHLEAGRLDAASAALDRAIAKDRDLQGGGALAAGLLGVALGEERAAERHLSQAVASLGERSPLMTRGRIALADVRARLGDVDGAIEQLAHLRGRPLALPGIAAMVETEVTLAAAQSRNGDPGKAVERLKSMLDFGFGDGLAAESYDKELTAAIARSEGLAYLLLGRLALDARDAGQAVELLGKATARLAARSDAGTRAVAQVLLGVAMSRTGAHAKAVKTIRAGADVLEERRTQLRVSDRRTAMILANEDVYRRALDGLARADRAGDRAAGLVAGTLVESLRRSAISSTLRAGPLPLGAQAQKLADDLAEAERAAAVTDASAQDVERLRLGLSRAVSAQFAAAYLPTAVTGEDLARAARRYGHILAFHVPPGGLPGWRAWVAPDGRARLDEIGRHAEGALAELADGQPLAGGLILEPWFEYEPTWNRLARALLPAGLLEVLERRTPLDPPVQILVVPDGPLASVPWAALSVAGEPLVSRAVVQLVPAVDLAGTARSQRGVHPRRVIAHSHALVGNERVALPPQLDVYEAGNRAEFVAALESRDFGGVYVLAHGDSMGLEQHLVFERGLVISAATALRHPWPDWVVFAACLAGRVSPQAGQEPLGLAISCMLRGCSAVMAAVIELTPIDAPAVCGAVSVALADGRQPAFALRDAQLRYIDDNPLVTAADCLGVVCISTQAL